jgi:hypothetical protein
MYQTINEYDFRNAFHDMGRGEQFSYEGLTILFDALEQYEVDNGEPFELDVIALCCDFSELSEKEVRDTYGDMIDEADEVEEFLHDNTWVLGSYEVDGVKQFIFQQF